MSTRSTGTHFENIAADYLNQHGLRLVARNVRLKTGEIDLIMRDSDFWVFIEVKFRFDTAFEHPLNQIRPGQLQRIRRSAQVYLLQHGLCEYSTPCRFDVVAITAKPHDIIWVQDAF